MELYYYLLHTQTKPAMQMAHQLLAMRGARIQARIMAALAIAATTGFLAGASHMLWFAIGAAILAAMLHSKKTHSC